MGSSDLERKDELHYVASLKIEKIRLVTPIGQGLSKEQKRVVDDVTHMTIKARDLDDLKSRISAHVDLVEDD